MENKTRVFTTFQQSIGIFQEKPKLANGEYENCGRQLARMISTQLCDKQLIPGLDTSKHFGKPPIDVYGMYSHQNVWRLHPLDHPKPT